MFFKKNKKEEPKQQETKKDNDMSKIIDEVLSEQAAEKEAAMQEAAQSAMPSKDEMPTFAGRKNKHVRELIEQFAANQNNDTFQAAFNALLTAQVLVPMIEAKEQDNADPKNKKFHPAVVQNKEKENFIPSFTDASQIPEEFAKQFTLVAMDFPAYCNIVSQVKECEKLLVNPFTKQFIANASIAGAIAKTTQNQADAKKVRIEFASPAPEIEELAKIIIEHFKEIPEIEKVYFAKMTTQQKTNHVFIIDCPAEKHQDIFKGLIEFFKENQIKFDIALMLYEPIKQVVEENSDIKEVYTKS